jgi:molybdate transport system substrate-binding protein
MATRLLLNELADGYGQRSQVSVRFESVGGVDAARRVLDGEAFDVVVLASDAIDKLVAAGRVLPGSKLDLVQSAMAIAVRAGAPRPDVSSEDALRDAVSAAPSIGYSTGPSGVALLRLFERWGLAETLRERAVQAPPGVAVATLLARGEVELGFQQRSEMLHQSGVDIVGPMPPGTQISTVFSGACCTASTQPQAVSALLEFMCSPAAAEVTRRHGMQPA